MGCQKTNKEKENNRKGSGLAFGPLVASLHI
jgi:hypothetical protein